MNERGGFKNIEEHEDIDVADRARQSLAFRGAAACLLVPRLPAINDAFDAVTSDQGAMVASTGGQFDRPGTKLGVLVMPAFEIQIDACAGALDQGLARV